MGSLLELKVPDGSSPWSQLVTTSHSPLWHHGPELFIRLLVWYLHLAARQQAAGNRTSGTSARPGARGLGDSSLQQTPPCTHLNIQHKFPTVSGVLGPRVREERGHND